MRIAVVGAAGRTGTHLLGALQLAGHRVTALVRQPDQAHQLSSRGADAAVVDVEGHVRVLARAFRGHDAVVFAATGEYDGPDRMLSVDLDGAVKTMDAARDVGATRFVLVSGLGVDDPDRWVAGYRSSYTAKHYAERLLMISGLDWTIVRPGALTEEAGSGLFSAGEQPGPARVPRRDVATFVAASLTDRRSIGRAYNLRTGTLSASQLIAIQAAPVT